MEKTILVPSTKMMISKLLELGFENRLWDFFVCIEELAGKENNMKTILSYLLVKFEREESENFIREELMRDES